MFPYMAQGGNCAVQSLVQAIIALRRPRRERLRLQSSQYTVDTKISGTRAGGGIGPRIHRLRNRKMSLEPDVIRARMARSKSTHHQQYGH